MLGWAITFLAIALIAAAFGFGGVTSASVGIAPVLFFVFLALSITAVITKAVRDRSQIETRG